MPVTHSPVNANVTILLTDQSVRASQSLQGPRHHCQKEPPRLPPLFQTQASPWFKKLTTFPDDIHILPPTLVLFIGTLLVVVFGFQNRRTKFSLTLPAWSRTYIYPQAMASSFFSVLGLDPLKIFLLYQWLHLIESKCRERAHFSSWRHLSSSPKQGSGSEM